LGGVAAGLGVGLFVGVVVGFVAPNGGVPDSPATPPMAPGAGALPLLYGRPLLKSTAPGRDDVVPGPAVVILGAGVAILSLFGPANTSAPAYGSGQAERESKALSSRPAVTLDTKERLYLNTACAEETSLPADTEQSYRYRNRGLRLLAVGSDRLFLIPDRWRDGCQVLVVPDDDSVRIQLGW